MSTGTAQDYYEILQVSANAEQETISRVYRALAQRFHPDNQVSGDPDRFRLITEAFRVIGDPEQRAGYDVARPRRIREQSNLISEAIRAESDIDGERLLRLTILELLYARRRTEPRMPGIFDGDLESLVGRPREHLEFPIWFLGQKGYIDRIDGSRLAITVEGVEYFESQGQVHTRMRQLTGATASVGEGL